MAINIPDNSGDVKTRVKNDMEANLPLSNPFLKDSWLGALVDSFSERVFDFFTAILSAVDEVFPDTTNLFVDRWASFYGLSRLSGDVSAGIIQFEGLEFSEIPSGTIVIDINGVEYIAQETVILVTLSLTVAGAILVQVDGTATFIGTVDHNLINGNVITIDATDAEYDGDHIVTIVTKNIFTFNIDSGAPPVTTFISGITPTFHAIVNFESVDSSLDTDLAFMTELTLQSPIINVNDISFVMFDGLIGSSEGETNISLKSRYLDIIRNPVAHFNDSDIRRIAKSIKTITRVFIQSSSPNDGQVLIFIMADNQINTIPDNDKISEVKNALLLIKPANMSDSDVIVLVPTPIDVDFVFTSLNPDTPTMRTSITENLKQFFALKSEVDTDVQEDAYRAAIFQTIDTTTGQPVTSFVLSSPSGAIAVSGGKIAILGNITYP